MDRFFTDHESVDTRLAGMLMTRESIRSMNALTSAQPGLSVRTPGRSTALRSSMNDTGVPVPQMPHLPMRRRPNAAAVTVSAPAGGKCSAPRLSRNGAFAAALLRANVQDAADVPDAPPRLPDAPPRIPVADRANVDLASIAEYHVHCPLCGLPLLAPDALAKTHPWLARITLFHGGNSAGKRPVDVVVSGDPTGRGVVSVRNRLPVGTRKPGKGPTGDAYTVDAARILWDDIDTTNVHGLLMHTFCVNVASADLAVSVNQIHALGSIIADDARAEKILTFNNKFMTVPYDTHLFGNLKAVDGGGGAGSIRVVFNWDAVPKSILDGNLAHVHKVVSDMKAAHLSFMPAADGPEVKICKCSLCSSASAATPREAKCRKRALDGKADPVLRASDPRSVIMANRVREWGKRDGLPYCSDHATGPPGATPDANAATQCSVESGACAMCPRFDQADGLVVSEPTEDDAISQVVDFHSDDSDSE
jgi:hypothetical protein